MVEARPFCQMGAQYSIKDALQEHRKPNSKAYLCLPTKYTLPHIAKPLNPKNPKFTHLSKILNAVFAKALSHKPQCPKRDVRNDKNQWNPTRLSPNPNDSTGESWPSMTITMNDDPSSPPQDNKHIKLQTRRIFAKPGLTLNLIHNVF